MSQFKASDTTLFFNTRDELVKVRLEKVAFFEADSNYCHVIFINGAKATLLTSLVNVENLLINHFKGDNPKFVRIGRRYIVNLSFIFQINIPRQKLTLTDYNATKVLEISISKDALKNLKQLYSNQ